VGAGVGAPAGASPAAPNPLRDPSLWRAWAVLLPLALGAVWAGHRVARALPGLALARAVYAVLAASGLALVVGQALQLCHWRL
jgi:uncharacterized membrane protein YfcA